VQCAESLRVQAYFDGELDAASAAGMEGHLEHCAECRATLTDLTQLRAALRSDVEHPRAPAALRSRIVAALDHETELRGTDTSEAPASSAPRARDAGDRARMSGLRGGARAGTWQRRPFFWGALSGFSGTAAAAAVAFLVVLSPGVNPLVNELVDAHVRSLMPAHLIDVVSTDQHTVKPWFAGHADVSPVVANFAAQGYVLVGGRADYFERQRAAVVVYQHGSHVINVFSWAWDGGAIPKTTTRNGYHLSFWRSGNLVYCAVSDAGWSEIATLSALLQGLSATDSRG
jgi:anti-sigma factor RsiW